MNSVAWAVWAAQAVGFEFFWATFEGGFSNFLWVRKKLKQILNFYYQPN